MCIRDSCVGKYVYDKRLTRKTCLTIDTDAGPRVLELRVRGGQVEQVTVDMGIPALSPSVSVEAEGDTYTCLLYTSRCVHRPCPEPGRH